MSGELFVPEDFVVPDGLSADRFRQEPLGATPGFPDRSWPHEMTLQENLCDLERHA